MSRSRRFVGGVSLGYLNQALILIIGLWLTPFLLKHIGQHDYGQWLVGLQVLTYVSLMDFGIVALLPRETAYATGRAASGKEGKDLGWVIGRAGQVVLYQTPLVAIVAAAFCVFMPASWHEIRWPITIALMGYVVVFPLRVFQAVLQGLQDSAYLARLQLTCYIGTTALMVILVLGGMHLYSLAISWVTGQILSAGWSLFRLRRQFPGVLPSRLPSLSRPELLSCLTGGFWVSANQVAMTLINVTDFVVISKFLGPTMVVPYACTQKLLGVLASQPYLLMEYAAPGLSQMKTSTNKQRLFDVTNCLTLCMLTVGGAISCVTIAVNHSFVSWWLGDRQFGGLLLTCAIALNSVLRLWNTTTTQAIFAFGYEKRITVTTLFDGVVTLSAEAILVPLLGPLGATLGMIIGVIAVSLPRNLMTFAREVQMSMRSVLGSLWPWFWRFLIVLTPAVILGTYWRANVFYLAAISAVIGTAYVAIMLPMIMSSHVRLYLSEKVTDRWDRLHRRLIPATEPSPTN